MLGEALDQNCPRALERRLDARHTLRHVDEREGRDFRIMGRVGEQKIGQRLQSGLAGDLRLGAAFWLEGQVEIFQPRLGVGAGELDQQFIRQLALLADALEDRFPAILQFAQVPEPLFQGAELRIVQGPRHFLAVTGDEGNRRAGIQQLDGGLDLPFLGVQFRGDALADGLHQNLRELRRGFYGAQAPPVNGKARRQRMP